VIEDFATGARFVAAVGEAGDALGHPSVSIGKGYVDFKLVSDDAIYRDDEGTDLFSAGPDRLHTKAARAEN
jgi:4a-hydroxytetrahydrobiopterin dehydratase